MPTKDPEKRRAQAAAWRARNPERVAAHNRRAALKRKYGMTPEEYDQMVVEQGARCAICGGVDPGGGSARRGNWHVDHCHETGAIRGLLCLRCNAGLGLLRDDPEIVRLALAYLETHSRPQSED